MRFKEKSLEIVVKCDANGDFRVESNSRENFRVFMALKAVLKSMAREINRQHGRLTLDNNHEGRFASSVN